MQPTVLKPLGSLPKHIGSVKVGAVRGRFLVVVDGLKSA